MIANVQRTLRSLCSLKSTGSGDVGLALLDPRLCHRLSVERSRLAVYDPAILFLQNLCKIGGRAVSSAARYYGAHFRYNAVSVLVLHVVLK